MNEYVVEFLRMPQEQKPPREPADDRPRLAKRVARLVQNGPHPGSEERLHGRLDTCILQDRQILLEAKTLSSRNTEPIVAENQDPLAHATSGH